MLLTLCLRTFQNYDDFFKKSNFVIFWNILETKEFPGKKSRISSFKAKEGPAESLNLKVVSRFFLVL